MRRVEDQLQALATRSTPLARGLLEHFRVCEQCRMAALIRKVDRTVEQLCKIGKRLYLEHFGEQ